MVIYKGDYAGNKTSLQKLEEIGRVVESPDSPEDKLTKIKEIVEYAPETEEPTKGDGNENVQTN